MGGAILLGPFVEYTKVTSSMEQNTKLDLIVNPSVVEEILPLRFDMCGGKDRMLECSPLYHPMDGLCPLFVGVSEHECLIDEDKELVQKVRDAGGEVELATQPYMPHVFQLLSFFLPEAARAEAE